MEVVKNLQVPSVLEQIEPTRNAFVGLLEKKRSEIESVKKETFSYAEGKRHQLDIYFPLTERVTGSTPILFFTYGGGLFSGDRSTAESNHLSYANLASYFVQHGGYIVIVADYRLVPPEFGGAKYPDCVRDILGALEWTNSRNDLKERDIILMGHSAGAMTQAQLLLNDNILPLSHPLRRRIKAVILNGTPYHFSLPDIPPSMPGLIITAYFGAESFAYTPMGLLKSASDDVVAAFPPLLVVVAEKEPIDIMKTKEDFVSLFKNRKGQAGAAVEEYLNVGHNHISSNFALASGDSDPDAERWGAKIVGWLKSIL